MFFPPIPMTRRKIFPRQENTHKANAFCQASEEVEAIEKKDDYQLHTQQRRREKENEIVI